MNKKLHFYYPATAVTLPSSSHNVATGGNNAEKENIFSIQKRDHHKQGALDPSRAKRELHRNIMNPGRSHHKAEKDRTVTSLEILEDNATSDKYLLDARKETPHKDKNPIRSHHKKLTDEKCPISVSVQPLHQVQSSHKNLSDESNHPHARHLRSFLSANLYTPTNHPPIQEQLKTISTPEASMNALEAFKKYAHDAKVAHVHGAARL